MHGLIGVFVRKNEGNGSSFKKVFVKELPFNRNLELKNEEEEQLKNI